MGGVVSGVMEEEQGEDLNSRVAAILALLAMLFERVQKERAVRRDK